MAKGLLINTEFCTGCHSCEVACKNHLGLTEGEWGIKLTEVGPYRYKTGKAAGKWEWAFHPQLTKACTLCEDRTTTGKLPMCVQHCQAWCIDFGDVEELARRIDGSSTWSLVVPQQA